MLEGERAVFHFKPPKSREPEGRRVLPANSILDYERQFPWRRTRALCATTPRERTEQRKDLLAILEVVFWVGALVFLVVSLRG